MECFLKNHLVKVFPIWLNLGVKMYIKITYSSLWEAVSIRVNTPKKMRSASDNLFCFIWCKQFLFNLFLFCDSRGWFLFAFNT